MKKSMLWVAGVVVMLGMSAHADMKCTLSEKDCAAKKAEMVDAHVSEMTKELGLSADQQAKVKAAMEKKMSEKCALHEETSKKMESISNTSAQEIRAVLTPEQAAKLDEMKKSGEGCCAGKAEKCAKCAAKDKTACCPKAGEKGHTCPVKKDKAACCPLTGGKTKK